MKAEVLLISGRWSESLASDIILDSQLKIFRSLVYSPCVLIKNEEDCPTPRETGQKI
jgi:hypothetical protein